MLLKHKSDSHTSAYRANVNCDTLFYILTQLILSSVIILTYNDPEKKAQLFQK